MSEGTTYRALFDLSPSAILIEDERGIIIDANPAISRIMGYTRDELIGLNVCSFVPAEAAGEVAAHLARILEGHTLFHVVTNLRKDGSEVHMELHERRIDLPDGRPGILVIANDVSERVQSEQALRSSQLFIEKMAETSPNALYLYDVQARRNVFSTPRLADLLGYTSRELEALGPNPTDALLHPDDRARADEHLQGWDAVPDEHVRSIEYRLRHKDGRWKWFAGSDAVFSRDARGRVKLIIGTAQDITEQKEAAESQRRLEIKMLQAQKLESLGLMAGGVAHDFNNMLVAILGNIDLALMDLPGESDLRSCLNDAAKASRRAADLCKQLLAYSGKGRFVVQPVHLNELLREFDPMLHASVSRKIEMVCEFADALPAVEADESQVRQVIMNLVRNAAEAIGDRVGRITLATGVLQWSDSEPAGAWTQAPPAPGTYVYFSVADDGAGMPPELQGRIFDPFFSTKFIGRGLGLPAVLGIVQGHRGAIRVESAPGQGSRFLILFPAAAPVEGRSRDARAAADAAAGAQGAVLLVDDEEQVRRLGKLMLERMGLRVTVACDGDEAIELMRDQPGAYDCVLLDLTMPKKDGVETLNALRTIRPEAAVILTSGYTEEAVLNRLQGSRHDAFVQKPFTFRALQSTIDKVMHR